MLYHFLHKKAQLVPVLSLMTPDNCFASQSFKTSFTVNYTAKTMSSKRCKFVSFYGQSLDTFSFAPRLCYQLSWFETRSELRSAER